MKISFQMANKLPATVQRMNKQELKVLAFQCRHLPLGIVITPHDYQYWSVVSVNIGEETIYLLYTTDAKMPTEECLAESLARSLDDVDNAVILVYNGQNCLSRSRKAAVLRFAIKNACSPKISVLFVECEGESYGES